MAPPNYFAITLSNIQSTKLNLISARLPSINNPPPFPSYLAVKSVFKFKN